MNARTVRAVYPILDAALPRPHLRLLARAGLADHLEELGLVAVSDVKLELRTVDRTITATVEAAPKVGGMLRPEPTAMLCPNCQAIISGVPA